MKLTENFVATTKTKKTLFLAIFFLMQLWVQYHLFLSTVKKSYLVSLDCYQNLINCQLKQTQEIKKLTQRLGHLNLIKKKSAKYLTGKSKGLQLIQMLTKFGLEMQYIDRVSNNGFWISAQGNFAGFYRLLRANNNITNIIIVNFLLQKSLQQKLFIFLYVIMI